MIRCTACGLELPGHARFCAGCGVPVAMSPTRRFPAWLPFLFGLGSLVGLLFAFGYWTLVRSPALLAARGIDPSQGGPIAVFFALWATLLVLLQAAAVLGLAAGRGWGRLAATGACALWSLTCVGVPLCLLVIYLLWRRPAPAGPGGPPTGPGTLGR